MLIESDNHHVCRLAHYHIRQLAPIRDSDSYRQLISALERQAGSPSPARRACATKTLAKVFRTSETAHATDFVMEVFNRIGGARVCKPVAPAKPMRIAGVSIGDGSEKKGNKSNIQKFHDKTKAAFGMGKIVRGEVYDYKKAMESGDSNASTNNPKGNNRSLSRRNTSPAQVDDGVGGTVQASSAASGLFVRSRVGKMLVSHATIAALRRINRVAIKQARVESYIFDSGLMSVVVSTVRHTMALLELRSTVSPKAVSQYLAPRLPHRGSPPDMRLYLEDLGARVYYARLISSLAEDPNLSKYIPDEAPKQAKRDANNTRNKTGPSFEDATTVGEKATQLLKFLFSREQMNNVVSTVRATASNALTIARPERAIPKDDSLGVEYAEALINLVKNASNRVLIETLRGLSRRKWTTWFEAPIPQSALYNAPELNDADGYGEADDMWDDDDTDDDLKDNDDSEDENELGAYEDDLAQGGGEDGNGIDKQERRPSSAKGDGAEPDLANRIDATERETLFSRMNLRRKERREKRIGGKTPFYLRKVQEGMVPALEIILRRIYGALLEDEPVRRFAAVDAVIVLARAKIYGHTEEEHEKRRQAQQSVGMLMITGGEVGGNSMAPAPITGGSFGDEKTHPLEALVKPLLELIDEDPNAFIRGRAAVALLFVVASGAGRGKLDDESQSNLDGNVYDEDDARNQEQTPVLLRLLGNYVRHPLSGNGVGLKQMSEVVDYLVYEVLDIAPDLAPSALALAEEWARVHPTVGVCGRLGAIWEKVLSLGMGKLVGESLIRSISAGPLLERVASAATIFLRRRALDVAVLTVGAKQLGLDMTGVEGGVGLPEPLPRAVGVEMEKYFSILWHCILVGPSAECRAFAVESLGGAAVIAGEPFRISTYERLVELVRVGGLGVRPIVERVLTSLDALYMAREQFSETRAKYRIARDGSYKGKEWLAMVWKLRCDAVNAAQIALGVEPPSGWLALGPGGTKDVANAERLAKQNGTTANVNFGNIGKDAGGAQPSQMGGEQQAGGDNQQMNNNNNHMMGAVIDSDLPVMALDVNSALGDQNDDGPVSQGSPSEQYERRRYSGGRYNEWGDDGHRGHRDYDNRDEYERRRLYDDRDDNQYGYDHNDDDYRRGRGDDWYDDGPQVDDRQNKQQQEEEDRKLAEQLQEEEGTGDGDAAGGGLFGQQANRRNTGAGTSVAAIGSEAREMLSSTAQAAERLFKQGLRGGKELTEKVRKTAARSAALDSLRNSNRKN